MQIANELIQQTTIRTDAAIKTLTNTAVGLRQAMVYLKNKDSNYAGKDQSILDLRNKILEIGKEVNKLEKLKSGLTVIFTTT